MTITRRARTGRTAALALALVAGSGGAIAMAVASPASAASQTISISDVSYTCTADDTLVAGILGPQKVLVDATSSVPDQVASGGTIAQTTADLTLTLTEGFVSKLRDTPGLDVIKRVRGKSTAIVVLTGVGAGDATVARAGAPVNKLVVPDYKELPAKGAAVQTLDLLAQGTIPAFAVPAFDGTAYISMPKTFQLQSEVNPAVLGSIDFVDLTCQRDSSDASQRVIGKVAVGTGCPADASCAFPLSPDTDPAVTTSPTDPTTSPTDPTTSPTSGTTGGSGGGSDDGDDSGVGSGGQDTGGFVVAASQVAPARTAAASDELPATGSPVGWLALAGVLLLGAGRVGVSLRERRAARA